MDNAAAWGLIVGIVTPYVIALVNQPGWTDNLRRVVAIVVSVLVGLGTAYFNNDVNFEVGTALASIAGVLVAAQAVYHNLLKPSAKSVERATSPGSSKHHV